MKMNKLFQRGQTLVEYALMLPLMLLIILFLADAGRAVYYYSVIHNAAREGARAGIICEPTATTCTVDPNLAVNAARILTVGLDQALLDIDVNFLDLSGNEVSEAEAIKLGVIVEYSFSPVTPLVSRFIPGGVLTLVNQSTMNIER